MIFWSFRKRDTIRFYICMKQALSWDEKHQNELRVKQHVLRANEHISIEIHTKSPRVRPVWWPSHLHADRVYCVNATCLAISFAR
jgi:hypothetical protein